MEIAAERGKSQVIYIEQDGYMLKKISIYSNTNPKATQIQNVDSLQAANMTDNNWDNGISKNKDTILFKRDDQLLIDFLTHEKIICNKNVYQIVDVDFDNTWIHVRVDKDARECQYPNVMLIE